MASLRQKNTEEVVKNSKRSNQSEIKLRLSKRWPKWDSEGKGYGAPRGWWSDPDEFFRQLPGDFLFFPVVTSGGGSSLQTIRSKIFTANPHPRCDTVCRGGWRCSQTSGMAAACSRKPINLYVCPPISSSFAVSPSGKYFTSSRRLSAIGTLSLFPRWDWFEARLLESERGLYDQPLLPVRVCHHSLVSFSRVFQDFSTDSFSSKGRESCHLTVYALYAFFLSLLFSLDDVQRGRSVPTWKYKRALLRIAGCGSL